MTKSKRLSQDATKTTQCLACRETIREGATVCIKCNARQDWRRHLNFSSTILSLLIAFLSVLSIGVPSLLKSLEPLEASISASLLLAEPSRNSLGSGFVKTFAVTLFFTNSGLKPGAIKNLTLRNLESNGLYVLRFVEADIDRGVQVIDAGGSRIIQVFALRPKNNIRTFAIDVDYFRFDGSIESFTITGERSGDGINMSPDG